MGGGWRGCTAGDTVGGVCRPCCDHPRLSKMARPKRPPSRLQDGSRFPRHTGPPLGVETPQDALFEAPRPLGPGRQGTPEEPRADQHMQTRPARQTKEEGGALFFFLARATPNAKGGQAPNAQTGAKRQTRCTHARALRCTNTRALRHAHSSPKMHKHLSPKVHAPSSRWSGCSAHRPTLYARCSSCAHRHRTCPRPTA